MAEWLGRWTWNPEIAVSSPALTISWSCFSVDPRFSSSPGHALTTLKNTEV